MKNSLSIWEIIIFILTILLLIWGTTWTVLNYSKSPSKNETPQSSQNEEDNVKSQNEESSQENNPPSSSTPENSSKENLPI